MSAEQSAVEDQALREKATKIAQLMCENAFKNPAQVERHLSRHQLMAYLICAFEYGSQWESRR